MSSNRQGAAVAGTSLCIIYS